jgi:CDP-diacylglycerol--glycerol-3-phosphate 3-phosphatidyltransferase
VDVAVVMLVEQHDTILFTLAACVIIGREMVVSALREWMAELGERASVAVVFVARVKTFVQMLSITALLALDPSSSEDWMLGLAYTMLYVAAGLTLYSMVVYLRAAWSVILERERSGKGDVSQP